MAFQTVNFQGQRVWKTSRLPGPSILKDQFLILDVQPWTEVERINGDRISGPYWRQIP